MKANRAANNSPEMKVGAAHAAPRRLLAALALAAVALAGMPPPASEAQSAAHAVFQVAEADWLVREKRGVWLYLAVAVHVQDPVGHRVTRALVTRSRCAVARTGNMEMIACAGGGRLRKIPENAFSFDPTLETAALQIPRAKLHWTGEGPIYPDGGGGADPYYGAFAYAMLDRWATAAGRVLGRRMHQRPFDHFAWLAEGAFAEVITGEDGIEIVFDDAGGARVRLERTISRPQGPAGRRR